MTPTCTFNWHKVWFSHGHTNIAGTKQVYLTVFAGFLHPSSNYSQRIYNQWSAVALFIRSNIFLKKRSNHGSLLFNVHSTIKTNKKIWSIMKISKNWHFRILDLSPCYASRPKTTLLSSFFPHIDSPSSPPPPSPTLYRQKLISFTCNKKEIVDKFTQFHLAKANEWKCEKSAINHYLSWTTVKTIISFSISWKNSNIS